MSRDPYDYRVYAIECAGLASSVRTPELQVMFSELSKGWETLARAIEEEADATLAQGEVDDSRPQLRVVPTCGCKIDAATAAHLPESAVGRVLTRQEALALLSPKKPPAPSLNRRAH
jgi:hypothetical protein